MKLSTGLEIEDAPLTAGLTSNEAMVVNHVVALHGGMVAIVNLSSGSPIVGKDRAASADGLALVRDDGECWRVLGIERHPVLAPYRAGEEVGFMLRTDAAVQLGDVVRLVVR